MQSGFCREALLQALYCCRHRAKPVAASRHCVWQKKTVSDGQVFRFGINSLLCRFSAKKRPISFVLYPQINSTALFDGGQNGVRRLCKTPFTAVLATAYCAHKRHLSLRSGGILPASGRVFNGGIINRGHLFENRVSYLRRYAVCRF